MQRSPIAASGVWWCGAAVCAVLTAAVGCGSSSTAADHIDPDAAVPDASAAEDADAPPTGDDGGSAIPLDAATGEDAAIEDAGAPTELDAGMPDPPPVDGVDPRFEVEMTFATVNIGRDYDTRAQVAPVFDRVGDVIGPRSGPRLLGWQEIGEGDPCGDCEIELIRARFAATGSWETLHPLGMRPDGGSERVKVPVTSKGAGEATSVRAVFASPGWAGVSPTRFVTVAYYGDRNVSLINTHFIAGAWSCRDEVAQRRDYWRRAWTTLRDEVAREHDRGRNVVVTGDLNRPRAADGCNPDWDPTSLHARARVIGGAGIDYVFAVPAAGWSFSVADRGSITLGIDGHSAHWVAGRFRGP